MISRRLIQQLDGYKWKGWTCYWEYPGFFLWSHPNRSFSIAATPDYNRQGHIDIGAFADGVNIGGPDLRYRAPLDLRQYLRLVTPWLRLRPQDWVEAETGRGLFPRAATMRQNPFGWGWTAVFE